MSTFNGIIHEFPSIRIDFFRPSPGLSPPLACFLSHVHSDHLAGLETLKSPFVYCSAATRAILLRLEKYHCRVNHALGILETRQQTYRHLGKLLKAIPLETPTTLELEPGRAIRVTLVGANHCAGAVMFLIEGDGKAVLYTGDIRSEPWWVNSIARSPSLLEYSHGLKTLDKIYLDTSMLSDIKLQSKAEGIRELLGQVAKYPDDTVFCMQAWTYGYEEVWIALSKALNSKIHVDKYKMRVYKSLVAKSDDPFAPQFHHSDLAPYLIGFNCGNTQHDGCLTPDEDARIHSCEKGTPCTVMTNNPIVWIKPIVAHLPGGNDMQEVGIGGGADDLEQEAQISRGELAQLVTLISEHGEIKSEDREHVESILSKMQENHRDLTFNLDVSASADGSYANLTDALRSLISTAETPGGVKSNAKGGSIRTKDGLPSRIVFPYARHSSLPELRHFAETFRPREVWPCTVDAPRWLREGITMRELFGDYCSAKVFQHDVEMSEYAEQRREEYEFRQEVLDKQRSQQTASSPVPYWDSSPIARPAKSDAQNVVQHSSIVVKAGEDPRGHLKSNIGPTKNERKGAQVSISEVISISSDSDSAPSTPTPRTPRRSRSRVGKRSFDDYAGDNDNAEGFPGDVLGRLGSIGKGTADEDGHAMPEQDEDRRDAPFVDSQASTISETAYQVRRRAFEAMEEGTWGNGVGLISTVDHHTAPEEELGAAGGGIKSSQSSVLGEG